MVVDICHLMEVRKQRDKGGATHGNTPFQVTTTTPTQGLALTAQSATNVPTDGSTDEPSTPGSSHL